MLFNSYVFLLVFLPIALIGFHLLRKAPFRVAIGWLVVTSLVYYGAWKPPGQDWTPFYLLLFIASCTANFFFGGFISRHRGTSTGKGMLFAGVVANLVLLGYYKYAGLFAKTYVSISGADMALPDIILPLGLSFFTFQQVAYLVDAWRGETEEYHITDYFLFVTFFPQLIAGPIVHHKEMLPQFQRRRAGGLRAIDLAVGSSFLAIGLFKKGVMADYLARTATPIFTLAAAGTRDLSMMEAWAGTLAYTLQIYFDFSGYSDMALGAARMFGIRLPLNFHSPYKATSIIEFWRRWHITLSRFLRDYLYFPLGGNRKGLPRRYANLLITMLLGGLWHGAGWTFLLWGGLHGLYLCANHGWHWLRKKLSWPKLPGPLAGALTFLAVIVAWVPFRAGNFELAADGTTGQALEATRSILGSMFGLNGFTGWPPDAVVVVKETRALRPILIGLAIIWLLPNTQEFFRRYRPALDIRSFTSALIGPRRRWQWRPVWYFLLFTLALLYAVGREFDQLSEFIYFQF
jgi:D-alanyl-lipoteichoic acid acyltransferase DltB (MBOAT superfamily)